MTERLLHFIWQFQYFNRGDLRTSNGEPLEVLFPGNYNRDQGPDFKDARIRADHTTWAGTVELHVRSSDWFKHKHQDDHNYRNVILHVVWEIDPVSGISTAHIPVLELKQRVPKMLLHRYESLMQASSFIPCEKMTGTVPALTWTSWKDRLLAERLLRKSATVLQYLEESNHHWEEITWWLLARCFGSNVNGAAFEEIARSLSLKLLSKHKPNLLQLEALLFGQAGMLNGNTADDYQLQLQKEYRFLARKYGLCSIHQPLFFLRMRPVNFPTIRLAQLAALLQHTAGLFAVFKEGVPAKQWDLLAHTTTGDYWNSHYLFGEPSSYKIKKAGKGLAATIISNAIAPLLFAWGQYHADEKFRNLALQWLAFSPTENNRVTRGFTQLGVENKNGADSQALIELKNEYCAKRRCLECGIGNAILKSC